MLANGSASCRPRWSTHRHQGPSEGRRPLHRFLCERNAVMTIYKNFSDETLLHTFGPAVVDVARCFWLGRDDTSRPRPAVRSNPT